MKIQVNTEFVFMVIRFFSLCGQFLTVGKRSVSGGSVFGTASASALTWPQ